ncbi:hypothetical protein AQUCO_03600079v1 [Aquilegia coerulea]|uniref:Uncharacterized protein n=1 Tax=Aquilegia coerulea TaxID=218851 RepID=A0A2G5CV65_AQUCA|nr:hypothetical protein AQUCO_03600079v1 [Aquilegia coerulea]
MLKGSYKVYIMLTVENLMQHSCFRRFSYNGFSAPRTSPRLLDRLHMCRRAAWRGRCKQSLFLLCCLRNPVVCLYQTHRF